MMKGISKANRQT